MNDAAEVMDLVAATYNDQDKAVVTYTVQLPYLNMALNELQEIFELNNVPVTDKTSAVISIPASTSTGIVEIGFGTVEPKLPDDLVEIQEIWERPSGVEPFLPMYRKDSIPHYLEYQLVTNFIWWSFNDNKLQLIASLQANQIKLDYIKSLFTPVVNPDGSQAINVINCKMFLVYRTGALLAQFIGENKTRADELNNNAGLAVDRALGISAKGRQAIGTRRRPFRAGYKSRQVY